MKDIPLKKPKKENIHKGHRERMFKRITKFGIASLADHEVLEYLLFFSIPRRNTNEMAHKILSEYANLHNVFEADYNDLMKRTGISERSAILLSSLPQLFKVYTESKWNFQNRLYFYNYTELANFVHTLFIGENVEVAYVILLDKSYRLINKKVVGEGSTFSLHLAHRKTVEYALMFKASYVILVHNHTSGNIESSERDNDTTRSLTELLRRLDIKFLDHIIVGSPLTGTGSLAKRNAKSYFSYAENKMYDLPGLRGIVHKPKKSKVLS